MSISDQAHPLCFLEMVKQAIRAGRDDEAGSKHNAHFFLHTLEPPHSLGLIQGVRLSCTAGYASISGDGWACSDAVTSQRWGQFVSPPGEASLK